MNIKIRDVPNSPIDTIKFHKLQRLLGADFVPALESFITQAEIYANAIHALIMDDRFQDAMGIAHKLKSSSGLYGFWKVAELSNAIERAPLTMGAEMLLAMQTNLQAALREAIDALDAAR